MNFSDCLNRFDDEVFAALNTRRLQLEAQGRTFLNLSIGTPDFETPVHIRQALAEAAMDPENWKYALRDTPEMLNAVCEYYQTRFHVTITPDMIASCYGSQEGIGHLGMVLCNPGDTVLLPSPCYPVFIAGAKMAGAEIVYYPLSEHTGFLPDLDAIPAHVADRARYMIVSLPSNPTGSVGTPEIYNRLIAFAREHHILLVHDNAYSDIIYDGLEGGSFLGYEHAASTGVEFFSLSKSFNLTGARISFLIGRPDVVAAFRKLRSQIDFGMFLPLQKAAIAALKTDRSVIKAQCLRYQERRDALCDGLTAIGWPVPRNAGSMFVWAKIPVTGMSSMDFCLALMDRAGVICTPGSSFGPEGEGYVRFALVLPPAQIRQAVSQIQESGLLDKTTGTF